MGSGRDLVLSVRITRRQCMVRLLDRVRTAMGGWPPVEGGIKAAMPLVR